MRSRKTLDIKWTPDLAYIVGLIATDGNLSKDGRHISFTSKDKQLVTSLVRILNIKRNKITRKGNGSNLENKRYYVVQFSNVGLYNFMTKIGITPNKTKTIGALSIPLKFFIDFIRGHLDGDGTYYAYFDRRWKSSYMFYTTFTSASKEHILWLRNIIKKLFKISGHLTKSANSSVFQLKYAKNESLKLIPKIYYDYRVPCLERKRDKIFKIIKTNARVL